MDLFTGWGAPHPILFQEERLPPEASCRQGGAPPPPKCGSPASCSPEGSARSPRGLAHPAGPAHVPAAFMAQAVSHFGKSKVEGGLHGRGLFP